jgi:NodT family efflux transporter outer membrane factor (OMF) lipoprotein
VVRLHALMIAAAVLGGCAPVGPDYGLPGKATVNAPAAQAAFVSGGDAVSREALPDHWWKLFDDPRLDDLIEKALTGNTDLRVAQANLERSHALLDEEGTSRMSGVADAEASYVQQSAEAVLQHVQPPERPIYNMGIAISYDLDLFGGIRRGIEAATADDEAAAAARDLVKVNIAAETTHAYADLCNAGNQLEVLRQSISVQEQSLALTRALIAHGRTEPFEQTRQQSVIEASQAQLAPLAARQRNAAFRLATLMGLPPTQYDPALLDCHRPLKLHTLLPTGDGQAMLKRRPDVRAAERRLAASTARIGIATAQLYPDIKLGASVGSTGAGADFLSALTNRFGVGPIISWDLNRSAVRSRIAGAEAQSRASLAAFDGVVLSALSETETSLDNYAASLDRLQRLDMARDEAALVLERTRRLRRGGKIGGLALLDVERTWVAAEAMTATAEADTNNDQIAAFYALGGGWS